MSAQHEEAAKAAKAQQKKKKRTKEEVAKEKEREEDEKEEGQVHSSEEPDLQWREGFEQVFTNRHSALFGPIEIDCTEEGFNMEKARQAIINKLEQEQTELPNLCKHGYKFKLGDSKQSTTAWKELKRRKQILAFSRVTDNL